VELKGLCDVLFAGQKRPTAPKNSTGSEFVLLGARSESRAGDTLSA
jgi:hypothetical protein